MNTSNYPAARPLVDPSGKVVFVPTHISYVIDGVDATNPRLKGSLYIGDTQIFSYNTSTKKVGPLPVGLGGTGKTTIADLANEVAKALGFQTTGSGGAVGIIPVSKGGTGATTAAAALTALGAASVKRYTATIPTGWTANASGGFMKAVTVSGVTANDCPIAGLLLSDDVATAKTQLTAAGNIHRIVANANSITLYAYNSAPTTAFNIQLLCVRGF